MDTRGRVGLFATALAIALGTTACGVGSDSVSGSGNIVSQRIEVSPFSRLEVADSFDVRVAVGASEAVTVRVDDNLLDDLDVNVANDTLRVALKPGTNVSDATLEADVTVQALSGMEASGASRIHLMDEIEAQSLSFTLSGASGLDGRITAADGQIDLSGASRAELTGSATRLDVTQSGASGLGGQGFTVESLTIDLSGASSAELTVNDSLSAVLSGASSLHYLGSPQVTRQETSGGSSITHT